MTVDQLPGKVREFANYLDGLLARVDQNAGWAAVFWQRDPDGMQACLDGREVPPWDVVEALLQDFAAGYGTRAAEQEVERARPLHVGALVAYDARPGGRDALGDRLDVMLREQRYAAERQAELGRLLAAATTREEADALRLDLAWARDDHERATARCIELRYRMEELDRRTRAEPEPVRRDSTGPAAAPGADRFGVGPAGAAGYAARGGGVAEQRGSAGDGAGHAGPDGGTVGSPGSGGGVAGDAGGGGVTAGHAGSGTDAREYAASGDAAFVRTGSRGTGADRPARGSADVEYRGSREATGRAGAGTPAADHPGSHQAAAGHGYPRRAGAGYADSREAGAGYADSREAGAVYADSRKAGAGHGDPRRAAAEYTDPREAAADYADSREAAAGLADPRRAAADHADPRRPGAHHATHHTGHHATHHAAHHEGAAAQGGSPEADPQHPGAVGAADGLAAPASGGVSAYGTDVAPGQAAPDPGSVPAPAVVPKQRKRRRGSARFAGLADDGPEPVTAPGEPAASAGPVPGVGRSPRGARFAGAAKGVRPAAEQPQGEAADAAARGETAEAVERLVRLRQEGRSGEAHALLVELAYWPAPRVPLLAAELQHAGLGADWATLLWEAASLPAERLVAAADALVEAGRAADGEQILRQGVARPAEEIGEAVRELVAQGRRREVRALLDAYVRVRPPEEAARSAAPDPRTLVPLLLEAARGVSDERHWDVVHALRVAGLST
ncbi:hypothetical protein [Streptomyces sp. NPDC018693]|uniref:hypothetical protein n=1 Tax=unclassified Streptomyces TaxID=2593676 RepID=UPI00379D2DC5